MSRAEAASHGRPAPGTGGVVVVKLGGTTLAEQRATLAEVAALAAGRPVVVVHGGGRRLTEWLDRLGVRTRFEGGLRVTDDAALEVVAAVLRGVVNTELVATLRALGADAVGLSGVDGGLLVGDRLRDAGRVVGEPHLRGTLLSELLAAGRLPVVAPLALDRDGVACNVNADDAAAAVAAGLRGSRLVLLTDTDGVRDASRAPLRRLSARDAERLISDGTIVAGMVPKVRAALRAVRLGCADAVIADGGVPGALGRGLDDATFGTRITASAGAEGEGPIA